MKKQLLLFATVLLSAITFAQGQKMALKKWETNAGIQAMFQENITKVDGSGNIYTAGATLNANGKYDIFLTKVTSGGALIYSKTINGTANEHDFALGLVSDGDDVYVTGTITNNTLTLVPELFLVKYNGFGIQQFFSTFSNGYGDIGKDMVINTNHNACLVTGSSYNSGFATDMVVISFDMTTGGQNWVNYYDYPSGLNDAGIKIVSRPNVCTITSAVTVAQNQYKLVTNTFTVATGWGTGTVTAGATATSSVEIIADLVSDAVGNIYICGATQQNAGQGYDYYIAKITSSLTISWEQTINGYSGSSANDFAKGIQIDGSGNVFVTGVTTHSTQGKNITTVKLNSSGVVQWTKDINNVLNGHDGGNDLALDSNDDIYVTGYQTVSANNTDIYTVKLENATGNSVWEHFEESDLNDEGTNIIMDNDDVIVAGSRETTPGNYEYVTYKFAQHEVITPTDFNNEDPDRSFMYYTNKGQLIGTNDTLVPDLKFYSHDTYPAFYFKNRHQSFLFSRVDTISSVADTLQRIDLVFTNSIETSETFAMEAQDNGYLNYYLGHTGNGIEKVKGHLRLVTPNLYSNIDLMCSSNQDGIKYYFIVKPGGDIRDIKMQFTGATSYSLDGTSNALSINSDIGSLTFERPSVYQLTSGNATVAVTGWTPDWETDGAANKYKFNDGAYTSSLTLVIMVKQEPISVTGAAAIPVWGTFYGGAGNNAMAYDIVTDNSGGLYATGKTHSVGFPVTTGVNYPIYSGGYSDAFMVKFDNDYKNIYAVYYGGDREDTGYGITYDAQNDKVYLCGATSWSTSPIRALQGSATTYTNNQNGTDRAFIARFHSGSGLLEWATRFGVSGGLAKKIKADANGNIYIIGDASVTSQTVSCSSSLNTYMFQLCNPGGGAFFQSLHLSSPGGSSVTNTFYNDGYIARFNSQTALTWSTYFGGNGDEYTMDLTVDDTNQKLYIVGQTRSTNSGVQNCGFTAATFPLCNSNSNDYYMDRLNGNNSISNVDGFISKFDLSTLALEWSTFYGGSAEDAVTGVVTDNNNNVFVTGYTKTPAGNVNCGVPSNNGFPLCSPGYSQSFGGGYDMFVSKFSSGGTIAWSTYFGGPADDVNIELGAEPEIAINSITGDIYVSGSTRNNSFFPSATGSLYQQGGHGDNPCSNCPIDGVVASFSNSGTLLHSTRFGGKGTNGDHLSGLATYQNKVYVCGGSYSTSQFPFACPPTANPYCNTAYPNGSNSRGFYAQLEAGVVGIQELQKKSAASSLYIYPNPTDNKLNIEWENTGSKKAEISVYNMMGQVITSAVIKENIGLNKQSINVSDLKYGLYLVVIKTDAQTLNAKFIKE